MLTIVDEYTRECLAIDVARNLTSDDVLERLTRLMVTRGRAGAHPRIVVYPRAARSWFTRSQSSSSLTEPPRRSVTVPLS